MRKKAAVRILQGIAFTTCETNRFKKLLKNIHMPLIEDIQTKIVSEQLDLSKHAVDQFIIRQIRLHEILVAILILIQAD